MSAVVVPALEAVRLFGEDDRSLFVKSECQWPSCPRGIEFDCSRVFVREPLESQVTVYTDEQTGHPAAPTKYSFRRLLDLLSAEDFKRRLADADFCCRGRSDERTAA